MVRFLRPIKRKSGKTAWQYIPPEDAVRAGVVKRATLYDGRKAKAIAREWNKTYDEYKKGNIVVDTIGPDSIFNQLKTNYLNSRRFDRLAETTKEAYRRELEVIAATPLMDRTVGQNRLSDLTSKKASDIYDYWLQKGAHYANTLASVFSVIMSYAESLDLVVKNPMKSVKKVTHKPTTYIWSREQVEKFIEVAFTKFEWRNVGLMALMCYEWAQRPIDICRLKWYNFDFDTSTVTIKQSKRGETVTLPVSDTILPLIKQQQKDYGFQDYVIPYFRPHDKAWRPMENYKYSVRAVAKEAGLPDTFTLGSLRKSGINEMVEAGVDGTSIMSVTGHKNLTSLNPYMKHTKRAAEYALSKRNQKND